MSASHVSPPSTNGPQSSGMYRVDATPPDTAAVFSAPQPSSTLQLLQTAQGLTFFQTDDGRRFEALTDQRGHVAIGQPLAIPPDPLDIQPDSTSQQNCASVAGGDTLIATSPIRSAEADSNEIDDHHHFHHRAPPTPDPEKPFQCDECPKRFKQRTQLRQHDNIVHKRLKPFQCLLCDLSFSCRGNFAKHLKTQSHARRESTVAESGENPPPPPPAQKSRKRKMPPPTTDEHDVGFGEQAAASVLSAAQTLEKPAATIVYYGGGGDDDESQPVPGRTVAELQVCSALLDEAQRHVRQLLTERERLQSELPVLRLKADDLKRSVEDKCHLIEQLKSRLSRMH